MNVAGPDVGSALVFENYTVNWIKFVANPAFNAESVAVNFTINNSVSLALPRADVTLDLKLFPEAEKNNYPFEMQLNVTGHFRVTSDGSANADDLFRVNAVAIMFPYLRALVTTFTANCNVPPLILPPVNVHKMIAQSD